MARNFKTPKKARTTYKVYDAYDRVVAEFVPGQAGVTEILIQQLHAADDDEYDANRREAHHVPVHYMAYTSGDAEEAEDRNSYLADEASDPSIIFEKVISRAEFKHELLLYRRYGDDAGHCESGDGQQAGLQRSGREGCAVHAGGRSAVSDVRIWREIQKMDV